MFYVLRWCHVMSFIFSLPLDEMDGEKLHLFTSCHHSSICMRGGFVLNKWPVNSTLSFLHSSFLLSFFTRVSFSPLIHSFTSSSLFSCNSIAYSSHVSFSVTSHVLSCFLTSFYLFLVIFVLPEFLSPLPNLSPPLPASPLFIHVILLLSSFF